MIDRRSFLNLAAVSAATGIKVSSRRGIRAIAFDGLAIFDSRPVAALVAELFPAQGADLMATWRTRQFEYGWQRTLTRSYVDFQQVTTDALVFACAMHGVQLTAANRERLIGAYLQLPAWPDVLPALQALKNAGVRMALLSNFSAAMLTANVRGAALSGLFDALLSTDAVRAYKPDPRSYSMGVRHFGLPPQNILFVAFGGWDVAGARRFGYPVYWCNRQQQPPEELGARADFTARDLAGLPEFVRARS